MTSATLPEKGGLVVFSIVINFITGLKVGIEYFYVEKDFVIEVDLLLIRIGFVNHHYPEGPDDGAKAPT